MTEMKHKVTYVKIVKASGLKPTSNEKVRNIKQDIITLRFFFFLIYTAITNFF